MLDAIHTCLYIVSNCVHSIIALYNMGTFLLPGFVEWYRCRTSHKESAVMYIQILKLGNFKLCLLSMSIRAIHASIHYLNHEGCERAETIPAVFEQ